MNYMLTRQDINHEVSTTTSVETATKHTARLMLTVDGSQETINFLEIQIKNILGVSCQRCKHFRQKGREAHCHRTEYAITAIDPICEAFDLD